MWKCKVCGKIRQWGFNETGAANYLPLLGCGGCGIATRHEPATVSETNEWKGKLSTREEVDVSWPQPWLRRRFIALPGDHAA